MFRNPEWRWLRHYCVCRNPLSLFNTAFDIASTSFPLENCARVGRVINNFHSYIPTFLSAGIIQTRASSALSLSLCACGEHDVTKKNEPLSGPQSYPFLFPFINVTRYVTSLTSSSLAYRCCCDTTSRFAVSFRVVFWHTACVLGRWVNFARTRKCIAATTIVCMYHDDSCWLRSLSLHWHRTDTKGVTAGWKFW